MVKNKYLPHNKIQGSLSSLALYPINIDASLRTLYCCQTLPHLLITAFFLN